MPLSGLVTLTFDLSISEQCHWSPVSRASFLPIFSFLCSSILDLGSDMGQTDGQTDHQCIMPPSNGNGGIIMKMTRFTVNKYD